MGINDAYLNWLRAEWKHKGGAVRAKLVAASQAYKQGRWSFRFSRKSEKGRVTIYVIEQLIAKGLV